MRKPTEWRDFAGQCLRQADRARTARQQVYLLRMAQTWASIADEAERGASRVLQSSGGGDALQKTVDGALQSVRFGRERA
jgi:hypothetical protein